MGDIKKLTNKYVTPSHPWRKERIDVERALRRQYGLKNSRELWKVNTKLKTMKDQVKAFATMPPAQAAREHQQLRNRLTKYGIMPEDGNMETVLGYTSEVLLNRRLQTVVVKRQLARTMRQARQFISHGHIMVGEKRITAPGYLVTITDETSISFKPNSNLASDQHPERISKEDAARKRAEEKEARRRLEAKEAAEQEEVVELSEDEADE